MIWLTVKSDNCIPRNVIQYFYPVSSTGLRILALSKMSRPGVTVPNILSDGKRQLDNILSSGHLHQNDEAKHVALIVVVVVQIIRCFSL